MENLKESLFYYETKYANSDILEYENKFKDSIKECDTLINTQIGNGDLVLSEQFISHLHLIVATASHSSFAGSFDNKGVACDWAVFEREFDENDITNVECGGDCWVLSQLYWGGHLKSIQFTIGWLCMNAVRRKHGFPPVFPPKELFGKLRKCLEYAGPKGWDAESLRALTSQFKECT